MGILKVSNPIHDELRAAASALNRSLNGQAEHWIKVGMLAELHQELNYRQLIQLILNGEESSFTQKKTKKRKKICHDKTQD